MSAYPPFIISVLLTRCVQRRSQLILRNGQHKITVTNHSDMDVQVSFTFTPEDGCTFNGGIIKLGDPGYFTGAKTVAAWTTGNGDHTNQLAVQLGMDNSTLNESLLNATDYVVVGTVTVTIS